MSSGKKKAEAKDYFLILANNDTGGSAVEVVRVDKITPALRVSESSSEENDLVDFFPLRGGKVENVPRTSLFHPESASSKVWAQAWSHTRLNFSKKNPYQKKWIDLCMGVYFRPCSVCNEQTRKGDFEELEFCLFCGIPLHMECEPTRVCKDCRVRRFQVDAKRTVELQDVSVGTAKKPEYPVLLPESSSEKPTLVQVLKKTANSVSCRLIFSEGQNVVQKPCNALALVQDLSDKQLFDLYHVGQEAVEEGIGPFKLPKGQSNLTSQWNKFLQNADKERGICSKKGHGAKDFGCEFCYHFFCETCMVYKELSSDEASEAIDVHDICPACCLHNERVFFNREHELWKIETKFRQEELSVAEQHPSKFVVEEDFSDGDLEVKKTGGHRSASKGGADQVSKRKASSVPLPRRKDQSHSQSAKPTRRGSAAKKLADRDQEVRVAQSSKRVREEEEEDDDEVEEVPEAHQKRKSPSKQLERGGKGKEEAEDEESIGSVDGNEALSPLQESAGNANQKQSIPKRTREVAAANQPQPAPAPNAADEARGKHQVLSLRSSKKKQKGSAKSRAANKKADAQPWSAGKRVEVFDPKDYSYYLGETIEPGKVKLQGIQSEEELGVDENVRSDHLYPVIPSEPNENYLVGDIVDVQLAALANSWWEASIVAIRGDKVDVSYLQKGEPDTVSKKQLRRNRRT